jgi:hypothetical protein
VLLVGANDGSIYAINFNIKDNNVELKVIGLMNFNLNIAFPKIQTFEYDPDAADNLKNINSHINSTDYKENHPTNELTKVAPKMGDTTFMGAKIEVEKAEAKIDDNDSKNSGTHESKSDHSDKNDAAQDGDVEEKKKLFVNKFLIDLILKGDQDLTTLDPNL